MDYLGILKVAIPLIIGAVSGIWGMRWRMKKLANATQRDTNSTIRDDIALNKEILNQLNELTLESAELTRKALESERRVIQLESDLQIEKEETKKQTRKNEALEAEAVKLRTFAQKIKEEANVLKKKVEFYLMHCKCNLNFEDATGDR